MKKINHIISLLTIYIILVLLQILQQDVLYSFSFILRYLNIAWLVGLLLPPALILLLYAIIIWFVLWLLNQVYKKNHKILTTPLLSSIFSIFFFFFIPKIIAAPGFKNLIHNYCFSNIKPNIKPYDFGVFQIAQECMNKMTEMGWLSMGILFLFFISNLDTIIPLDSTKKYFKKYFYYQK